MIYLLVIGIVFIVACIVFTTYSLLNKGNKKQSQHKYIISEAILMTVNHRNSGFRIADVFQTLLKSKIEFNYLHEESELNSENYEVDSHFQYIWDAIIIPSIKSVQKDIDKNFGESTNLKLKDLNAYKTKLKNIYVEKREWLKKVYLKHEENPILDMHKIASVICRSMIKIKPFEFDIDAAYELEKDKKDEIKWCINNLFINYKCAYKVAIGITYYDLLYQLLTYKEGENPIINNKDELDGVRKLVHEKADLIFYFGNEQHENYEDSTIIALATNDINVRKFDYLAYATIFYQLQQYALLHNSLKYKNKKIDKIQVVVD